MAAVSAGPGRCWRPLPRPVCWSVHHYRIERNGNCAAWGVARRCSLPPNPEHDKLVETVYRLAGIKAAKDLVRDTVRAAACPAGCRPWPTNVVIVSEKGCSACDGRGLLWPNAAPRRYD